jgi:hypothetical protein
VRGSRPDRYGTLMVLPAKMNPDFAMGDELLKKTGAGNLFMVFGEPDVEIRRRVKFATHRPTISPAGSSIPSTTARVSSSGMPTSPARTSRTKS